MEDVEILEGDDLSDAVRLYNRFEGRRLGQHMLAKVEDSSNCRGGVILHINIRASLKLVSTVKVCDYTDFIGTSFQFKPGTLEVVEAASSTTGREVVKYLLKQLRIQTDESKLMLMEQNQLHIPREKTHISYRKLDHHEKPLLLTLGWAREGLLRQKKLVLADHVPGVQDYSGMSLERLRAALQLLSEEEEAAVREIQRRFSELKEATRRELRAKNNAKGLLELRSELVGGSEETGGEHSEKRSQSGKVERKPSLRVPRKPYRTLSASFNSPDKSLKPFDKEFCSLS